MDYFFDFKPISQQPDSTQSNATFMQQNDEGFMGQQSIMSSQFEDTTVDSLVTVKTKKLRAYRKKKKVKSYKYLDSYLIVKKDSFAFLNNIHNQTFLTVNFDSYIAKNNITKPVYKLPKLNLSTDSLLTSDFDSIGFFEQNDSVAQVDSVFQVDSVIHTQENQSRQETVETTISEIPKKDNNFELRNNHIAKISGEFWLMGVLLAIFLFFAFLKMQFSSKISVYFQSVFSYQSFFKMFREQNTENRKLGFFLSSLFNLNISLLIYYSLFYHFSFIKLETGFTTYLIVLAVVISVFLLFTLLNKFLALVFESYNLLNEILYNLSYTHRVLGLFLLPTALLFPYVPVFLAKILLIGGWGLVAVSFVFRWFRAFLISFNYRVSYFYMILYLCALELIPLMFIGKMILSLY